MATFGTREAIASGPMGFGLVVGVFLFFFGLITGAIEFADQLKGTAVHYATQAVRPTLSATHAAAPKSQPKIPATPPPIRPNST
jgi:hypothetical protein